MGGRAGVGDGGGGRSRGGARPPAAGRSRTSGWPPPRPGDGLRAPRLSSRTVGTAPHTHGRPGGQTQPPVAAHGEPLFDQPVLARVVGEDSGATTGRQPPDGIVQGAREDVELVVDRDADGLEDPAGGMAAGRRAAAGMASRTISASSPVVVSGRAAMMARTIRRAKRPSPLSPSSSTSSRSLPR